MLLRLLTLPAAAMLRVVWVGGNAVQGGMEFVVPTSMNACAWLLLLVAMMMVMMIMVVMIMLLLLLLLLLLKGLHALLLLPQQKLVHKQVAGPLQYKW
jgi:hypothetical protein